MKALQITEPGQAAVVDVPEPEPRAGELVLRVRMVGMCGSDLNTFRGKNPLVSYPRILGHEIAATVENPGAASDLVSWKQCDCFALHQLRFLLLLFGRPAERLSPQPNVWRAAGWRAC